MSSNITINDADLKSRLAHFGIISPITNTTRQLLLKKLYNLEISSIHNQSNQNKSNTEEQMDTSTNDLNEYEIRNGISKLGYKQVPLTDTTRPILSNILRKRL